MQQATVYLDHNLISRLRPGHVSRDDLLARLNVMRKAGVMFVVSPVNIREARCSGDVERFAQAMEDIDAWYIDAGAENDAGVRFRPCYAAGLVRDERDFTDVALHTLESFTKVMHFVAGSDQAQSAEDLVADLNNEWERFWNALLEDTAPEYRWLIPERDKSILPTPELLNRLRSEATEARQALSVVAGDPKRDPSMMPADCVAEHIFSILPEKGRAALVDMCPRNLWLDPEKRSAATVAGLAALFAAARAIKPERSGKGDLARRQHRVLRQQRDNEHIGFASYCDAFLSTDGPAVRLAEVTWAWTGVTTVALHLKGV